MKKDVNALVNDVLKQAEEHKRYLHGLIDQIRVEVVRKDTENTVAVVYAYPDNFVPALRALADELEGRNVKEMPQVEVMGHSVGDA